MAEEHMYETIAKQHRKALGELKAARDALSQHFESLENDRARELRRRVDEADIRVEEIRIIERKLYIKAA